MASANDLMSLGFSAAKAQAIQHPQSTDNVHDTAPTNAQLVTAFGPASAAGRGFIGTVDDAGAGTLIYLVVSDGTSYFYTAATAFTKAT